MLDCLLKKPEDLSDMFKDRARRQALRLQERFAAELAGGKSFTDATNATAIHGYKAAASHSAFVTISRNLDALNDFVKPKDIHIYRALLNLFELTALVQIKDDLADWIGVITTSLADSLMDQIHVLLDRIRPDAVGLVDALGFQDEQLKSTLGRYDGNVYGMPVSLFTFRALSVCLLVLLVHGNLPLSLSPTATAEAIYNEAKLSPLNRSPKMVGWESLSKVLDLDFIKEGIGQRIAPAPKM